MGMGMGVHSSVEGLLPIFSIFCNWAVEDVRTAKVAAKAFDTALISRLAQIRKGVIAGFHQNCLCSWNFPL